MKPLTRSKSLVFSFAFLALFLSGCSFVRIQNVSDVQVRVLVRVPDSRKGYTRQIPPGYVVDVFTSQGGRYTINTLPNERYREFLLNLQTEVSRRLFDERHTLSGADVTRLVARLNEANAELEKLEQGTSEGSCSGYVPDFDTVVATIVWDLTSSKWSLACQ
jgi:hypothetical protein